MKPQSRKKEKVWKVLSKVNQDWCWASSVGEDSITLTPLHWWERILYWKWPDKSFKK